MKRFNKIVSTFKKTITKLETLESACNNRVEAIETQIVSLNTEKTDQKAEGRAAANTAAKLKELIGD